MPPNLVLTRTIRMDPTDTGGVFSLRERKVRDAGSISLVILSDAKAAVGAKVR